MNNKQFWKHPNIQLYVMLILIQTEERKAKMLMDQQILWMRLIRADGRLATGGSGPTSSRRTSDKSVRSSQRPNGEEEEGARRGCVQEGKNGPYTARKCRVGPATYQTPKQSEKCCKLAQMSWLGN